MATLAGVLKRPFWLPKIPAFAIRLMVGQRADILLNGSRVSSEKIVKSGFRFQFPQLERAIEDLCAKP